MKALGDAPKFSDLEDDALRVIDADPTDIIAFEAIRVVLRNNGRRAGADPEWEQTSSGKLNARMAQLLLTYHLNRPEFLDAAFRVSFIDPVKAINYWEKILAGSSNHDVRGQAAATLMKAYFNRSNVTGLPDQDRETLRQQALNYAHVIHADYADVDSLEGRAEKMLRALEYSMGATLPNAEVATVAGRVDSLAHYRGKVVLLEFWATWCSWCRKGQPELATLREDMAGKPFEIISISVDETPELVTRYMAKDFALPWPQWYVGPQGALLKEWGVEGYPTYLLLDAHGVVQARSTGSFAFGPLKDQVQQLVSQIDHNRSNS